VALLVTTAQCNMHLSEVDQRIDDLPTYRHSHFFPVGKSRGPKVGVDTWCVIGPLNIFARRCKVTSPGCSNCFNIGA
jgi:hypothetical protein